MRIVLTVNTAWNLVHFRKPLISALLADGHEVMALAPPDDNAATLQALGCHFSPLAMDRAGLSPARDAALLLRFVRHLRKLEPDVVFSYTIKNNLYGAIAARLLRVPFVPTVTGLGTAFLSGPALRIVAEAMYRGAFARVPAVFFQNDDDRAHFVARRLVAAHQVRMVPGSGIDLEHFKPDLLPAGRPGATFLLIARMLRDKGVVEFVEAARKIRAVHPEVRFELLGPLGSANRSAIDAATVDAWVAEKIIRYYGSVNDVRPFIARADCVVLPSYREGTARTLLEAAAMAKPLIATDVPGCRAVVEEGSNGLLCRARSAEDLAAKMLQFLSMPPERRRSMGEASRAKAEREFDERIVVERYLACLANIFAENDRHKRSPSHSVD